MKKKIIILGLTAVTVVFTLSSCKKLTCQCVGTGRVSESTLNEVLNRHLNDCVTIAETGPITDNGVNVSCSY